MRSLIGAAVLAAAGSCLAADLFVVDISSSGQSAHVTFGTAVDALDAIKVANLKKHITYSGTEVVQGDVNYRGLPMFVGFLTANDATLTFRVPSLGIDQTFIGSGASVPKARNDAQKQLVEYLKTGNLLGAIQQELARVSPVDPVAGNPASLQSVMISQQFQTSFTAQASNIAPPPPAPGQPVPPTPNLIGLGIGVGSLKSGDFDSRSATLPLSYTLRSSATPGHQFTVDVPLTVVETQGARSYAGGVALTYRRPITARWALAPSIGYAATGSPDLGSAAQIASGALTSSYEFPAGRSTVAIGNMVGYYETLKFKVADYSFDPDIHNTVFRNGVMASVPFVMGSRYAVEYSYINTQFTGTKLYNQLYNEFGVTVGTAKGIGGILSYVRVGATYVYAPNSKGFTFNGGYWF